VSEKAKLIRGDPPKIALKRRGSHLKKGEFDWGELTDIDTDREVIFSKIKNLNEFKAIGVDKVSNAVLKSCVESFVGPIG
jgi:hypothetical protein